MTDTQTERPWVRCDANDWQEAMTLGIEADETVEFNILDQPGLTITIFGGCKIYPRQERE